MHEEIYESVTATFTALSDPTRLRLLTLMAAGRPITVTEMVDAVGESQPKVSRHLAALRNAELVSTQRDGKCIYYALAEPQHPRLRGVMRSLFGPAEDIRCSENGDIYDESYVWTTLETEIAESVENERDDPGVVDVRAEDLLPEEEVDELEVFLL